MEPCIAACRNAIIWGNQGSHRAAQTSQRRLDAEAPLLLSIRFMAALTHLRTRKSDFEFYAVKFAMK